MSAGTHAAETVTLATLPSGVELTTTVHTYDGPDPGPTLYVQAAQHGREVNGVEVLRRFHDRLSPQALAGRIITVPVANPLTFDRVSYTTPEVLDGVNPNMNRVWPGDETGSLHERLVATLWAFVTDADAVVDLHTGSPDMHPHVVFTADDPDSRALAEAYGTDLLLAEDAGEDAPEAWHRRGFEGKLRVAASRTGIPAITPEVAHNKQIVEAAVETAVDGLLDVARHLELLDGTVETGDQRLARNHLGKVSARDSGLFRPRSSLTLGSYVPSGTALGTVYQPATFEPLQQATTDRAGILYALTREATVTAGDQLASVAVPESE